MRALVIADHDHQSIKGSTLNTVTAALACAPEVHVLVAGHNAGAAAAARALPAAPRARAACDLTPDAGPAPARRASLAERAQAPENIEEERSEAERELLKALQSAR